MTGRSWCGPPRMARPGSSRAFRLRCGRLGGRRHSATPGRGDVSHRLQWISLLFPFTVLADATNRFMWSSWLQLPKDTLVNLCLSFPFLLTPLPWGGTLEWTIYLCQGWDLPFPLVQRTRFVKNVNNRLLSRTGQWGRRLLLTRNASRVFRLLYL